MSLHRLFASTFLLLGAACGRIGFEEVALGDQGPRDQGDLTDQASADEGTDAADVGSDAGTNGLASSCARCASAWVCALGKSSMCCAIR